MNKNMQLYYDYTVSPLGKLFYTTAWRQLGNITNNKILDFGSGFGFTSNYLAKNNQVTAIEKNEDMIVEAINEYSYNQIHGDIESLTNIANSSYDIIICHLVLEFVENPKEILNKLLKLLKPNGFISIIRHNHIGRVIQAVVQDYDLLEAKKILNGEFSYSSAFGNIKYYENDSLKLWADNTIEIEKCYGIRALASLHNSDIQSKENWLNDMLEIESELLENDIFIKIAYFNHLILKKLV